MLFDMPSELSAMIFLSVFLLGYFAVNAFVFWRIRTLWFPGLGRAWGFLAATVLTAAYPIARIFAPDEGWPTVEMLANLWMGVVMFLCSWFLAGECVWFVLRRKGCGLKTRNRIFFTALALSVLTALWGWVHAQQLYTVQYAVKVDKSAPPFSNLRVVVLSDLHLGKGKPVAWMETVVAQTNAQAPDMVLLVGDIVDSSVKSFESGGYAEAFRKLNAPLGVFAVRGNHDFFESDSGRLKDAFKAAHITLIDDSVCEVQGAFYMAGRKDYGQTNRLSLEQITKNLPKDKPLLLLDHRPNVWEESAEAGVDIQFSGHTHGGQFFPATLVTKLLYTLNHGMMQEGPFTLIVSSGAGLWGPPFRVGSQSEIVVVDITFHPPPPEAAF